MRNIIVAILVIMFVGVAATQAQRCRILAMADDLGLSEQQQKQLQADLLAEKKDMIQLKADLAKAKLEMQEIMMAENIDRTAATNKQEQISKIKAGIAKRKLTSKIDRLNMLNKDQRAKLHKMGMGFGRGEGRGHEGCRMKQGAGCGSKMGHPSGPGEQGGPHSDD